MEKTACKRHGGGNERAPDWDDGTGDGAECECNRDTWLHAEVCGAVNDLQEVEQRVYSLKLTQYWGDEYCPLGEGSCVALPDRLLHWVDLVTEPMTVYETEFADASVHYSIDYDKLCDDLDTPISDRCNPPPLPGGGELSDILDRLPVNVGSSSDGVPGVVVDMPNGSSIFISAIIDG